MKLTKDKVALIDYTLKNDEGQILDSSEGHGPLAFIQGHNNIIPGLEKALEGKKAGDKIQATIAPEDGYGPQHDQLIQSVPLDQFEDKSQIEIGAQFEVQLPHGLHIATITQLGDTHATIDLNHPLAGETLHFDVTIADVRDATEEELAHGHVHGEGGHDH